MPTASGAQSGLTAFEEVAIRAMEAEILSEKRYGSLASAAAELGMDSKTYSPAEHYPILVAKRAVRYASALWSELEKP
jgi:hypothetical protein